MLTEVEFLEEDLGISGFRKGNIEEQRIRLKN